MTVITLNQIPDVCPDCRCDSMINIIETYNTGDGLDEVVECGKCNLRWTNHYDFHYTEVSINNQLPDGQTAVNSEHLQYLHDIERLVDHFDSVQLCKGGRPVKTGLVCPHCESNDPEEVCNAPLKDSHR